VKPTRAILVVDDNPRLCELAKRALSAEGWDVEVASSRRAALARAARRAFALALSDYAMPGGNGLLLLSELKRLQPHCCLVLWSADLPAAAASRASAIGVQVSPGKLLGDRLCEMARASLAPTASAMPFSD
jgi:CheY-like chemotaxis protein